MDVLVTGGTGTLGRQVVPRLVDAGHRVRILSRRAGPAPRADVVMIPGDLATGHGVAQAVGGAEVIVHCASSPFRTGQVDVEGTARLLRAAVGAGCRHLVYISIVGIDRVPYPYYRMKLATEEVIEGHPVPWTILRTTQFHALILWLVQFGRRWPFVLVPKDFVFQPVDVTEVADRMAELALGDPAGRVPDMGGPAVRSIEDLARSYLAASGRRARVVRLPIPGKASRGFRAGWHTCPDHADGTVTWEEFLRSRFGPSARL